MNKEGLTSRIDEVKREHEVVATHMEKIQNDVLFHRKQGDAEQRQDHQLDRTDFTQQSSVCDETSGDTEVGVDDAIENKCS